MLPLRVVFRAGAPDEGVVELLSQRRVQARAQVVHRDASPVGAQHDRIREVRLVARLLREGTHLSK